MPNPIITNVDLGRCVLEGRAWRDELLVFAGDDTFVEGTILARQADGRLVPFDPAAVGGAQNPMAVLPYEVSKVGAGNLAIRALVGGRVNRYRLVIDVDGHGDNLTPAMLDQLRAAGIDADDVQQLSELDNQ